MQLLFKFALVIFIFINNNAFGQSVNNDEMIYSRSIKVSANEDIEIYQDGIEVEETFILSVDWAYKEVEKLLQRKFNKKILGNKIKIIVSNSIKISHVWHGYQHAQDPRGMLFLNRSAYIGFKNKSNATLVHELTHLLMWQYESHTLREGLADFVAKELMPNTDVGPNKASATLNNSAIYLVKYLGSNLKPPLNLINDLEYRKKYYFASYYFVQKLIDKKSLKIFLELYEAINTEKKFIELYGASRIDIVCNLLFNDDLQKCHSAVNLN